MSGRDRLGRARRPEQNAGKKKPAKGDGGYGLRCPSYLGAIGKRAWKKVVEAMRDAGVLDSADWAAVELFAAAYESYRGFQKDVNENGATVWTVTERGHDVEKPNPAVKAMFQAMAMCRQHYACLGIGPDARAKLGVGDDGEQEDPFESLMRDN